MFESFERDRLLEVLKFSVKLTALSSLIYLGYLYLDFSFLERTVAYQVGGFLEFFKYPARVAGSSIFLQDSHFFVTADCTGWKGLVFFFALIISTGSSLVKKLKGLAINLPLIYSFNLLRVVSIVSLTSLFGPQAYSLFHDLFWQLNMIVFVLALWYMWWQSQSL